MNTVNRVTISGFVGSDAKHTANANGRDITRLSVATTKRYKDQAGNWQEKTQWHNCVAFAGVARYASKIQTGAQVYIEGELAYREYTRTIETESGPVNVQWPVTDIHVVQVLILSRTGQKQKGAA